MASLTMLLKEKRVGNKMITSLTDEKWIYFLIQTTIGKQIVGLGRKP